MFHHSTTIHHRQHGPQSITLSGRPRRAVYLLAAPMAAAGYAGSKAWGLAKGAFNISRAVANPPWTASKALVKGAYDLTAGKIAKGLDHGIGTALEIAKNMAHMVINPTRHAAEAIFGNLKTDLIDIPKTTIVEGVKFPFHVAASPWRFMTGLKDTFINTGIDAWEYAKETRNKVASVIENIANVDGVGVVKSTYELGKHGLSSVKLAKHSHLPLLRPMEPLTRFPRKPIGLFAKAKWKYAEKLKESMGGWRENIGAIVNAPWTPANIAFLNSFNSEKA
ncbi:hypothetical protein IPJ72_00295 [Candidatus Peregrinibacteria bacterium]|nr:MAG: hypothetical protein IPJ72_00295 [Candidatus Peregrinibacteria bacterium]